MAHKCKACGYVEIMCEVQNCTNEADYEGWYRVLDFLGTPTGLIQRRRVCRDHMSVLIGAENKEQIIDAAQQEV